MITVIHGDNIPAGYNYLQTLLDTARSGELDILEITADKTTPNQLIQALEATSLLSDNKLVVIAGLFTMRKKTLQKEFFILINQPDMATNIICVETKSLTKTQLKRLTSPQVTDRQFKLPVYIWKFLDAFSPPSHKQALQIYTENLADQPPELIIFFLLRHLRTLILAHGQALPNMPSWRKSKLTAQARKFQLSQLISLHHHLTQASHLSKTEDTILELKPAIKLILLSLNTNPTRAYSPLLAS